LENCQISIKSVFGNLVLSGGGGGGCGGLHHKLSSVINFY